MEMAKTMVKVEDIVLQHSGRGMDVLRQVMPEDYITECAKTLEQKTRGTVLLATGFYVAGYAETDGPAGTYFLAKALEKSGFDCVIVTDSFCRGFFPDVKTEYVEKGFDPQQLLDRYQPVAMISIERCGKNTNGDYANMRGVSIAEHTPEIDDLFALAQRQGIYTVGVGDGGNEIGMGNVQDVIAEKLALVPCVTRVTRLIIATVSNWGAYALAAELSKLRGEKLLAETDEIVSYIAKTVEIGSVDGVNKVRTVTVDGFDLDVSRSIVDALHDYIDQ